jgi:hypothetical protein
MGWQYGINHLLPYNKSLAYSSTICNSTWHDEHKEKAILASEHQKELAAVYLMDFRGPPCWENMSMPNHSGR